MNAIKTDLLVLRSPNLSPSAGENNNVTLDISITPPATPSKITSQRSDVIEDSSADHTFFSINFKFREIAAQHDFKFSPFFETNGYVHPTSLSFLNAIITKSASFHDVPRSIMKNCWMRLSAALQIGQTRLLRAA